MSTPALPPTPVGEDAVSDGDAASSPTTKETGTTSDEDLNYGRWVWALSFLLLNLVNDVNNMSGLDGHVYSYSYIMCNLRSPRSDMEVFFFFLTCV